MTAGRKPQYNLQDIPSISGLSPYIFTSSSDLERAFDILKSFRMLIDLCVDLLHVVIEGTATVQT